MRVSALEGAGLRAERRKEEKPVRRGPKKKEKQPAPGARRPYGRPMVSEFQGPLIGKTATICWSTVTATLAGECGPRTKEGDFRDEPEGKINCVRKLEGPTYHSSSAGASPH
jgi:hypothetical protein